MREDEKTRQTLMVLSIRPLWDRTTMQGAPQPAMSRLDSGPTQNLAENKLFVGGAPPGCDEATLQAVRQPRLLHNPQGFDIN